MAKLIAHNPPKVQLKSCGYIGEPTGNIDLLTQGVHNVKPFATATVKLPMEEKTVPADLEGQTITPSENYAGISQVTVEPAKLEEREATPSTAQQDITPSENFDALSKVTVLPAPLESKTITPKTTQETYTPQAPNIGFSEVKIEPVTPPPTLIAKQITENGVYKAEDDNADGYSEVDINVNEINAFLTKTIKSFSIPDVTDIANYQFANQSELEYVNMPNVITIGRQGFRTCYKLSIDELPIGLTNIGDNCFENCPLRITELPPNILTIGDYAFSGCSSIPYLDLSNLKSIPQIGVYVFRNTTFPFLLEDQAQLDDFASATNWSTYADRFQIKGA